MVVMVGTRVRKRKGGRRCEVREVREGRKEGRKEGMSESKEEG